MEETFDQKTEMKKTMNGIGLRWGIFLLVTSLGAFIIAKVLYSNRPELFDDGGIMVSLILTLVLLQIFGTLLVYFMGKSMPVTKPEESSLGFGKCLLYILIGIGLMGTFGVVGMAVDYLCKIPMTMQGLDTTAGIATIITGSDILWRVLVIGIGAPVAEELLFRKFLIDRLYKHGQVLTMVVSGLMFGLFHGNFQQFFGTCALGMFLAFVYMKTGRIRYCIMCHMSINMITSVITTTLANNMMSHGVTETSEIMALLSGGGMNDTVRDILLFSGWMLIMFALYLIGFIVWIVCVCTKKLRLDKKEGELTKLQAAKQFFATPCMWVFIIVCLNKFAQAYIVPLFS